jgi:ATP-dependent Zn protease
VIDQLLSEMDGFDPRKGIIVMSTLQVPSEDRSRGQEGDDRAGATASSILRDHHQTLEAVVRLLLEREVVEGDDVRKLLAAEIPQGLRAISA